jgi:hypothetical protein
MIMKKLLMALLAVFLLVGMTACGEDATTEAPRTYAADGVYTAFEVDVHYGAPMVTEVSVTIENDEITGFYIDARQSTFDDDNKVVWNAETKKELGDRYGMVERGGATLEWYEQAELIEAAWLANGYDSVTIDGEGDIDNVANVTISDGGYIALAAEAVQQAIDGVLKSYVVTAAHDGTADITWAELTVNEDGEATDLVLDTLQSSIEVVEGTAALTWDAETKQEKGDRYGMVDYSDATLEWYEQANLITDYVLANGLPTDFVVGNVDDLSAVTITTSDYEVVLADVFDLLG